ncbi:HAD family hydrolase [Faecalibacterium prausnitzii]|uniref:HAD family phosphatase n=1 Tax=Faecalibacterium prausnitzii TaxID=853 RepID=A0A329UEC1_9FIRM|nr:HAD family phosphatase [Faecalibacterium prausnitzii]RAW59510.1 HAD family phosphatase [Faecalibacterium prausnitzii]
MINGVIFDMDGTMFDTERMWATFWDPALKALGLPYKEGLAEAARGTAGETTRNVVRSFYGPDCDADGIVESLHRVADEVFLSAPVPKKPGLDALLAWLDEQRLPMAVASSSREAMIRNNLDQWGMTHYFKAIVSGQHVAHSKPDPEIFLLTAKKLGVEPARCLVLEDSYNGVRAGARGGFITVMVPDLVPADDEMRSLYTMECASLDEVLEKLKNDQL